ncbi:MAG: JAB domain-containing protein [Planctomycetaceae bacterium]|nr:JAB domain-containing protein [Planctomycetaceae bacterium]
MITLNTFDRSPRLAELKVSYKRQRARNPKPPGVPPVITSARTAEEYLRSVWNRDTLELVEDFFVVCLNTAHEPLGWVRVSSGGFDSTSVDPRLIFGVALQVASAAILIAHNHPSGDLSPSAQDKAVTQRLKEAGQLLRIPVLDHIILSKEAAFSFADHGLL